MKELILIRHAKSSWNHPGLGDHDRPLNKRGKKAAPLVGEALAERGLQPDLMLSSTAMRAYTTARAVAEKLGYPGEQVLRDEAIYLAGVPMLMHVIQGIDESHESAILFGHNPGFHDLANALLRTDVIERLVTCAVVRMRLNVDHWGEVSAGDGELIEHLWPRMLAGEE